MYNLSISMLYYMCSDGFLPRKSSTFGRCAERATCPITLPSVCVEFVCLVVCPCVRECLCVSVVLERAVHTYNISVQHDTARAHISIRLNLYVIKNKRKHHAPVLYTHTYSHMLADIAPPLFRPFPPSIHPSKHPIPSVHSPNKFEPLFRTAPRSILYIRIFIFTTFLFLPHPLSTPPNTRTRTSLNVCVSLSFYVRSINIESTHISNIHTHIFAHIIRHSTRLDIPHPAYTHTHTFAAQTDIHRHTQRSASRTLPDPNKHQRKNIPYLFRGVPKITQERLRPRRRRPPACTSGRASFSSRTPATTTALPSMVTRRVMMMRPVRDGLIAMPM